MDTFQISLNTMPEIRFAHAFTTNSYNKYFEASPTMLEITYIENGTVVKKYENGKTLTIPKNHIMLETYDCRFHSFSNESHSHCTIAFNIKNKHSGNIELPYILKDTELKYFSLFSQAISCWSENTPVSILKTNSYLLFLIAEIAKDYHNQKLILSNNVSASSIYYVEKAKNIIATGDFSLSLTEIANKINISEGHLSRIFKQVAGTSITDYINKCCLEKMKNIIMSKDISLTDAAKIVGIKDEHYASKLFKKYIGVSFHDFQKRNIGK